MDKNQEPILTDLTLSPEELAMRQRQATAQVRKPTVARTSSAADNGSKQTLAAVALIFAVLAAAGAGYLFLELQKLQQDLSGSKTVLESQTQNLSVLNDKLSVTGENANLSVDALKIQITQLNEEVQRLQENGKKDRADLNVASKDVQGLKTAAAQATEAQGNSDKKNVEQDEAVADLKKRLGQNEAQLKALPEMDLRLAQQSDSISSLQKDLAALKKDITALKKVDTAVLRAQLDELSARVDRLQASGAGVK